MRKIGTTDTGLVIIEMSMDRWERLLAQEDINGPSVQWVDHDAWRHQFVAGVEKLGLPARPKNAILRGTDGGISSTEPGLGATWVRVPAPKSYYLTFDEWCEWYEKFHDGIYFRNLGQGGKAQLLEAIKKYREAKNDT